MRQLLTFLTMLGFAVLFAGEFFTTTTATASIVLLADSDRVSVSNADSKRQLELVAPNIFTVPNDSMSLPTNTSATAPPLPITIPTDPPTTTPLPTTTSTDTPTNTPLPTVTSTETHTPIPSTNTSTPTLTPSATMVAKIQIPPVGTTTAAPVVLTNTPTNTPPMLIATETAVAPQTVIGTLPDTTVAIVIGMGAIVAIVAIVGWFMTSGLIPARQRPLVDNHHQASYRSPHQAENPKLPDLVQQSEQKGIRILFLAANPSDEARLHTGEESRAMDEALQKSKYRDLFDIKFHDAVRPSDLAGLLLRHQPHIVHFSGHGSTSNAITFEDTNGKSQPVSQQAISRLFATLTDNIKCVILNACYSKVQAEAIANHIDCVIGMSTAIEDRSAISFATTFYRALGEGRNIQTAFNLGCVEINLNNTSEEDIPQLIAHRNDPNKIFLTQSL